MDYAENKIKLLLKSNLEILNQIREYINKKAKQYQLLNNKIQWNIICASFDTFEDSSSAIEFYIESIYPSNIGGKYLYIYGLLQSIILQQDALLYVIKSLTLTDIIPYKELYPKRTYIREIRNNIVGHPISRNGDTSNYLAQFSLCKWSLSYMSSDKEGAFNKVDIKAVLLDHSVGINGAITEIINSLAREYKDYIKRFRGEKMVEIFNNTHYYFEKIFDTGFMKHPLAAQLYESLKGTVKTFKEKYIERYNSLEEQYEIEQTEELIKILDKYLLTENENRVCYFLMRELISEIDHLKIIAKDIDDEFNTN